MANTAVCRTDTRGFESRSRLNIGFSFMDKEREIKSVEGYSEKELDIAMDKTLINDQVKGGNIFDPKKVKHQPQQPR